MYETTPLSFRLTITPDPTSTDSPPLMTSTLVRANLANPGKDPMLIKYESEYDILVKTVDAIRQFMEEMFPEISEGGCKYISPLGTYEGTMNPKTGIGKGRVTLVNLGWFEGDFNNKAPHGFGTMKACLITVSGLFVCGFPDGVCIATFVDKKRLDAILTGEYIDPQEALGLRQLQRYEGQFSAGHIEGEGTYTWVDGRIDVGVWREGKLNGDARTTYANGEVYEGHYQDDMYHGRGKLTNLDGSTVEGDWEKGILHGQITMKMKEGDQFQGTYVNGKRHGTGTITDKNGNTFTGRWQNDKLQNDDCVIL